MFLGVVVTTATAASVVDATGDARIAALFSAGSLADYRAEPGFDAAARQVAESFVALYRDNRVLRLVVNDQGRMVIGWFVISLHSEGGEGLTVSRISALCERYGICSAGRAAAMVGLMRATGYLVPAAVSADRRQRRLVPTERFLTGQWSRWRAILEALRPMRPHAAEALAAIGDPVFDRAFVGDLFDHFNWGFRFYRTTPELAELNKRKAAVLILFSLFLDRQTRDDGRSVSRLSVSELARRFQVSRVHVIKVLREAQDRGLVRRGATEGDPIEVTAELIDVIGRFLACCLILLDHCSRRALDISAHRSAA